MRPRSNRALRFAERCEPTDAREQLERRWAGRLIHEPRLATLVTAEGAKREPIHRWHSYRQGFSPGLVRLFLGENPKLRHDQAKLPILDPFSGSGTCVVECARHGVSAIGVEALPSLVFLAAAKFERLWPPLPARDGASDWMGLAEQLDLPIHRAALMLAEARRHSAEGRPIRGAKRVTKVLTDVAAMIREDLGHPLTVRNPVVVGDARNLDGISDGEIGGIVTSPPYLSRYDYARINDPIERVYRFWHPDDESTQSPKQVRGDARSVSRNSGSSNSMDAVVEAAGVLETSNQRNAASALRDYFGDISQTLCACRRVMRTGSVAWWVVGGARIKDVYVPADLIVAQLAEGLGLEVSAIRVARELSVSRRKFGRIGHLAPRESVVVLKRS